MWLGCHLFVGDYIGLSSILGDSFLLRWLISIKYIGFHKGLYVPSSRRGIDELLVLIHIINFIDRLIIRK